MENEWDDDRQPGDPVFELNLGVGGPISNARANTTAVTAGSMQWADMPTSGVVYTPMFCVLCGGDDFNITNGFSNTNYEMECNVCDVSFEIIEIERSDE